MAKQNPKGSQRRRKRRARHTRRTSARKGMVLLSGGPAHDDCVMCRAMVVVGVVQGQASLSPDQSKRFMAECDRIFAEEGVPHSDRTGEQITAEFDAVNKVLLAEGRVIDIDAMDDRAFAKFMNRVLEIQRELGPCGPLVDAA